MKKILLLLVLAASAVGLHAQSTNAAPVAMTIPSTLVMTPPTVLTQAQIAACYPSPGVFAPPSITLPTGVANTQVRAYFVHVVPLGGFLRQGANGNYGLLKPTVTPLSTDLDVPVGGGYVTVAYTTGS